MSLGDDNTSLFHVSSRECRTWESSKGWNLSSIKSVCSTESLGSRQLMGTITIFMSEGVSIGTLTYSILVAESGSALATLLAVLFGTTAERRHRVASRVLLRPPPHFANFTIYARYESSLHLLAPYPHIGILFSLLFSKLGSSGLIFRGRKVFHEFRFAWLFRGTIDLYCRI